MRAHFALIVGACLASTASVASAQPYGGTPTQPATQPPAQPAQPGNDGFSSGGLAPPAPMDQPSQPAGFETETQRRLSEAEKEDSGRGLEWFYVNVEGGYEFLGLETLKSDGLTYGESVSSSTSGPMVGAGAGIRLIFLTLGARARVGLFEQWSLTTINAEVGIHIPIGEVEPYFTFGGGYAFLGGTDSDSWGGDVTVRGWNARAGFGLDYYVTPVFSIGGNLTGEALFLSRPGLDPSAAGTGSGSTQGPQLDAASQKVAEADGSSIGGAVTGSAVLGLHF